MKSVSIRGQELHRKDERKKIICQPSGADSEGNVQLYFYCRNMSDG